MEKIRPGKGKNGSKGWGGFIIVIVLISFANRRYFFYYLLNIMVRGFLNTFSAGLFSNIEHPPKINNVNTKALEIKSKPLSLELLSKREINDISQGSPAAMERAEKRSGAWHG